MLNSCSPREPESIKLKQERLYEEVGDHSTIIFLTFMKHEGKHKGNMSLIMRKGDFCLCENKDADQLGSNCAADQRLCFRYMDSTIPLLSESKISSLWPSSVGQQPGLCETWSETWKTNFLNKAYATVRVRGVVCAWTCVCRTTDCCSGCRRVCGLDADLWLQSDRGLQHFRDRAIYCPLMFAQ